MKKFKFPKVSHKLTSRKFVLSMGLAILYVVDQTFEMELPMNEIRSAVFFWVGTEGIYDIVRVGRG